MQDILGIVTDPLTNKTLIALSSKKVSGLNKLIQIILFTLLSSSGTDLLDSTSGGGLLELPNMNIDPSETSELYGEISKRVAITQSEIITNQIGKTLDPEEKLRSITISSLNVVADDEVEVYITVENEVGRTKTVSI